VLNMGRSERMADALNDLSKTFVRPLTFMPLVSTPGERTLATGLDLANDGMPEKNVGVFSVKADAPAQDWSRVGVGYL
jgi:hypothetical protein